MKTLFGAILVSFAVRALAQQDFSGVEVKAIPVAENIYMLTGAGGNIGVSVGPEGILIVDDQFAPLAEKIKANGLPEKWKSWEAPTLKTDRWLEILYRGLKAK
ncbi:MAG TPA: hypothetical protein VGK40_02140 [Verrucomicrobiae bacterium]|jgi:hypothetical protein